MAAKTLPHTAVPPEPTFLPEVMKGLSQCDPYAVRQLADFGGPQIFNPLIGHTPTDTFDNLEMALGAMSEILDKGNDIDSTQLGRGLKVMTDCMWAATQYEAFRAQEGGAA